MKSGRLALPQITINMLAKKFGLFGSRESEVFHILRARYEQVKYGKLSFQDPKVQISASMFLIFWDSVTFLSIFCNSRVLRRMTWKFLFLQAKKVKNSVQEHNRTTDAEKDRNPE